MQSDMFIVVRMESSIWKFITHAFGCCLLLLYRARQIDLCALHSDLTAHCRTCYTVALADEILQICTFIFSLSPHAFSIEFEIVLSLSAYICTCTYVNLLEAHLMFDDLINALLWL